MGDSKKPDLADIIVDLTKRIEALESTKVLRN